MYMYMYFLDIPRHDMHEINFISLYILTCQLPKDIRYSTQIVSPCRAHTVLSGYCNPVYVHVPLLEQSPSVSLLAAADKTQRSSLLRHCEAPVVSVWLMPGWREDWHSLREEREEVG